MRRYELRVTIDEGSDEFWDDIRKKDRTGCDELLREVKEALSSFGFMPELGTHVELVSFRDE